MTAMFFAPLIASATSLVGNGRKATTRHLLDDVLRGAGHGAHAENDGIRALNMVAHDAAVLSAEQLAELLEALVQNARGGAHSEILRTLDLGE